MHGIVSVSLVRSAACAALFVFLLPSCRDAVERRGSGVAAPGAAAAGAVAKPRITGGNQRAEWLARDLKIDLTGEGTVVSTPSGIDCGASCATRFNIGTVVTLTATPAAGQSFAGWSGACSGFAPTCTFTMSAARDAVALFRPNDSNANLIGINAGIMRNYMQGHDRMFADAMKLSNVFGTSSGEAAVDAAGWPLSDFTVLVWPSTERMHGTYALSFKGEAVVKIGGTTVPTVYDAGTNTSTGSIAIGSAGPTTLLLNFTATKRTGGSATGTGVTAISLMRPTAPGATTSYPQSTVFTDQIKIFLTRFSVVRFMDFLGTNSNEQAVWADRVLPSAPSFHRNFPGSTFPGRGGSWEHVIMLLNETDRDGWINIPARADDDYILKVAQMMAYGSDGVNPYTRPQANPKYPPLEPGRKLYIEYSNETWNSGPGFDQFSDINKLASDELVATAGRTPLNWDSRWNGVAYVPGAANGSWQWVMAARYTAMRGVRISEIFRGVFGGKAMMSRIRPVLMSKLNNATGALQDMSEMLFEYFYNQSGSRPDPDAARPPSYYFYGGGGSAYYSPNRWPLSLDGLFADGPEQDPKATLKRDDLWATWLRQDHAMITAMGLRRIAYEGGMGMGKDAISCDGADGILARQQPVCNFKMPKTAMVWEAVFATVANAREGAPDTAAATKRLKIFRMGAVNGGRVVSSPAGLDCGSACEADFPAAQAMTLTALPSAGYKFVGWGRSRDFFAATAIGDPRMTTTVVDKHNEWTANGGDLLVYYISSGSDFQWDFTDDVSMPTTPKLAAVDALNAIAHGPVVIGTAAPGSVAGNAPSVCSRKFGCSTGALAAAGPVIWNSYTFRTVTARAWTLKVAVASATTATVAVFVDGKFVGNGAATAGTFTMNLGPLYAGTHAVMIRATTGSFAATTITIE